MRPRCRARIRRMARAASDRLPDGDVVPATTFDEAPARAVLQSALTRRVFPAASIEVGTPDRVLWRDAVGALTYDASATCTSPETIFDLASLTKVLATGTVAMRQAAAGVLDLDAPVRRWLPEWQATDRLAVTVRDLLEHASGLPAWLPLYRGLRGSAAFVSAICRTPLAYAPRTASTYSDLGFILLGALLEVVASRPFEALVADALPPSPPQAIPICFCPPAYWGPRTAPAQTHDVRGPIAAGEVDDANAWALGGMAGHSGLFGTAPAVGRVARALLAALDGKSPSAGGLADPAAVRLFLSPSAVPGSSRALAWDRMRPTSSCGSRMSASAVGHTGFTGTSLWIDPERRTYVVLLTNRVFPTATDVGPIRDVRRAVHDAVFDALSPA